MKRLIVWFVALVLTAGVGYPAWAGSGQFDFSLRRGETRKTLPPGIFVNPIVKRAYAVAKKIPWVLDSIYCYCFCEESPAFRHKSLLSCYAENHAAQ